jgi:hypothetical protein
MKELVIKLLVADKETLGAIRAYPYVQVGQEGEWIWLRGIEVTGRLDTKIRQLPAVSTFEVDEEQNLFPPGRLTPVGRLPEVEWMPIHVYISPQLPISAMPGQLTKKYQVKLVPSGHEKPGEAILTTLSVWKKYADAAPEVRLKALQFAVSATDQVLILGTPLPSIPGKEYWRQDTLLLPAGFNFEIPLISGLITKKLNLLNDSLILFKEDGRWEKILKTNLTPATRSAVRLISGEDKA